MSNRPSHTICSPCFTALSNRNEMGLNSLDSRCIKCRQVAIKSGSDRIEIKLRKIQQFERWSVSDCILNARAREGSICFLHRLLDIFSRR